LPPLPLPALEGTMHKLLRSAAALDAPDGKMLRELERKVADFVAKDGVGWRLQKRLEERKEIVDRTGKGNWLAEWWDLYAYMSYRDTVVGNVSYYYGFPPIPPRPSPLPNTSPNSGSYHASSLVLLAFEFRSDILNGTLKPDVAGGAPLCMESYKWAYGGCRIPGREADWGTVSHPAEGEDPHFVVARRGWYWKVEYREEYSLEDWMKVFDWIYEKTPSEEAQKVGVLTGINRDTWAEASDYLKSVSPLNAETLHQIQTAQFFIGLDSTSVPPTNAAVTTPEYNKMIEDWSIRLFLGGEEPYNRWWDTPLQWVVEDGGFVGLIGEHSCMDGTPTARLHDWIGQRMLAHDVPKVSSSPSSLDPSKVASLLKFQGDKTVDSYISSASKEFADHATGYNVEFHSFQEFGKESIKKIGVSPDAFCQMAIQLGYFKTHGQVCGTYESAMTRRFHLGRTDVVRSCTIESRKWVEAMVKSDVGLREKKELFLNAVKSHGRDMKDASKAEGIDRHILGLKLSVGKDEKTPELFEDALLKKSSTWNLSTSQVYSPVFPAYGWGPVTQDGYGIPYMIHSESLQWTVTSK
ncbi:acyltransferase ChoActase/COT/CPT, partial [Atractiella rhizophila]